MHERGFVSIIVVSLLVFLGIGVIIYRENTKKANMAGNSSETIFETQALSPTPLVIETLSPTITKKITRLTPTVTKTIISTQTPTLFVPSATPPPKPLAYPTSRPGITCSVYANPSQGPSPLAVELAYSAGYDSDKKGVTGVQWDYDGDGNWDTDDTFKTLLTHTYPDAKEFYVGMKVIITDSVTNAVDICYASKLIKVQ